MTFYKFFPNKLDLAKAVFDSVVGKSITQFKIHLDEAKTASELLANMLQMKRDGIHDISKEFVTDFYANPELGLKDYINEKTQQVWHEMVGDFKLAQERGLFRKDLNIEFFLYFTRKFSDYLDDPYMNQLFPNPQDLVMELTRMSAYGISPYSESK